MSSISKGALSAAVRSQAVSRGALLSASHRDSAKLLIDADFANGVYKLNGAAVTYSDIFDPAQDYVYPPGPALITPGVGIQSSKPVGSSTTGYSRAAYFRPAIVAMLNAAGGFTVVTTEKYDNMTASGPTDHVDAQALASTSFYIMDADYAPMKKSVIGYQSGSELFRMEADQYDYDYVETVEVKTNIANASLGTPFDAYRTKALSVYAYYGLTPEVLAQVDQTDPGSIALPAPAYNTAWFHVSASSHYSDATAQNMVSSRNTLSRLRIYTPGQAPGWVAP